MITLFFRGQDLQENPAHPESAVTAAVSPSALDTLQWCLFWRIWRGFHPTCYKISSASAGTHRVVRNKTCKSLQWWICFGENINTFSFLCQLFYANFLKTEMVQAIQIILGGRETQINSLAPGKFEWNFRFIIFKFILVTDGWNISCEIALIWMSMDLTDDKSTLVQVMAWCRQATSHYLSQCWPRSMTLCGVTRPQ